MSMAAMLAGRKPLTKAAPTNVDKPQDAQSALLAALKGGPKLKKSSGPAAGGSKWKDVKLALPQFALKKTRSDRKSLSVRGTDHTKDK